MLHAWVCHCVPMCVHRGPPSLPPLCREKCPPAFPTVSSERGAPCCVTTLGTLCMICRVVVAAQAWSHVCLICNRVRSVVCISIPGDGSVSHTLPSHQSKGMSRQVEVHWRSPQQTLHKRERMLAAHTGKWQPCKLPTTTVAAPKTGGLCCSACPVRSTEVKGVEG